LASACGAAALHVFARPRVAILTTGDELVPPETEPAAGQIRNSNAPMLAAMVDAAGGDPWILPPAADHPEALDAALASVLAAAPTADLLLVSGGLSSGKFDLVQPALARAGARLHFSGVRMQPGRPTVFGELPSQSRSLPFVAAAGNPVSAAVAFAAFVAPLLAALAGRSECTPHFALARLAQATEKHTKPGLTRFLPARCSFTAEAALPWVDLIPSNGSGDLVALAQSNCFVLAPPSAQRIKKGATVRIVRST
jgi:molybdopterin molybdotransferase